MRSPLRLEKPTPFRPDAAVGGHHLLTSARLAQAIAKVQDGYVGQTVAEAKAALASKELPKPEAVLATAKAAAEKTVAVTKAVAA